MSALVETTIDDEDDDDFRRRLSTTAMAREGETPGGMR
jgi:hypothetical protein